ncbi:MAG: M14 metallopeptidase family protein [Bryobacterales bacterium]|nr:M14 metallopeptidase family protein [Bryobacterales bacterium]
MLRRSLLRLFALSALAALSLPAQVTAPEDHFGFAPGADYKLATFEEIHAYFKKLDAESERMRIAEMGLSTEGRPVPLVFISSPANLAKLDAIRRNQKRMALAEVNEAEARAISEEAPAVVWIDTTMHSTETVPGQTAPLLAYRLLSDNSRETLRILDNVVLLLVPTTNPDGMQAINEWYGRNVGTEHELAPYPGLYQRYAGHDNNRDWYMLNLAETRNAAKVLFEDWFPHIVYNQHQTAPFPARIFIPPYAEPMNPNIPPAVMEGISMIGLAMKERLALEGKTGAVSYANFDGWWNGGLRSTPAFHNMHGILSETAGFLYATPFDYDPAKLPKTFATGVPTKQPSIFYTSPWKGGRWSNTEAVQYNLTASLAVLHLASSMPEHWSLKAWRLAREQMDEGEKGTPYAYVIPAKQWDPSSAQELVRRLQMNGVRVERASDAFTADGKEFQAGSYVIPAAQPFRGYLMDLLEPHNYPEIKLNGGPVKEPYDSAGYTLSLQMGVDVTRVNDRFQANLAALATMPAPAPVWDRKQNASFWAVADALARNAAVGVAPDGTWLTGAAAGNAQWTIKTPRVGVYEPYRSDMDGGWTQWLLDYYRVPYRALKNEDVRSGKLRDRYDAIVIASQSVNAILHGYQAGLPTLTGSLGSNEQMAAKSLQRPEYTGGIGVEGVVALRSFVEQGGTLLTFGEATNLPIDMFPLPVTSSGSRSAFKAPGAVLRIRMNGDSLLAAGMPRETYAFVDGGYAFESKHASGEKAPKAAVRTTASYAERDLLASGWIRGEDAVKGKDAVTEVSLGDGRVVLFGIRPQFRGQTFATFKLVLNAIYLSAATKR